MISSTSICNLALSHFVGGGKITSLDDATNTARILKTNYENCLQTVLRSFPWTFARTIDTLDLVTKTYPNYDYVYKYPTNCMRISRVCVEGDLEEPNYQNEYKELSDGEIQYIASNIENAYIEYTLYVTNPTMYDSQFVKALSYLIASEVSNVLTGNSSLAKEMYQKFQLAIGEAYKSSANEANLPVIRESRYINARNGTIPINGRWGR
jgi:hypothetical protein